MQKGKLKIWYNPTTKDFIRTVGDASGFGYQEVLVGTPLYEQAIATFKSWGLK